MNLIDPHAAGKVSHRALAMVGKALDFASVDQEYIFEGLGYRAHTCPEWIPWEDWVQIIDRLAEQAGSDDELRRIGYFVFKGPAALFLLRLVGFFADLSSMLMRMNELIMRTFFKGLVIETKMDREKNTCEATIVIPEEMKACRSFLVMSSSAYESIFRHLRIDYKDFSFEATERQGRYVFTYKNTPRMVSRLRRVYRVIVGADFAVRQIAENEDELRRRLEIVEAARAEAEDLRAKEHNARKIAEEALQVRQRFLAVMSHELRTPLNHIIGCASILSSEDIEEDQQEYVDIINKSAYNLLDLIEQVLDFTSAGMLAVKAPQECLLSDLFDPIIDSARHECERKGIYFKFPSIEEEHSRYAIYDAHLKRIMKILMENAIKFTNEGGITLEIDTPGAELHVVVRDTGIGIPEEWQGEIFEPFRAVDSSDTRSTGGIGLGLTIARKLSREIGGDLVLVESSLEGSVFKLTVPLNTEPEKVVENRASNL